MVRAIALIAIGVGVVFLVVSWRLGRDIDEGVVLAIGVTVALVPEALLPTVTLSLAWGAERMAGRQVLVRNLDAVETLGSTTFICTDKTGTLPRNEMSAVEVWTPRIGDDHGRRLRTDGNGVRDDTGCPLGDPPSRRRRRAMFDRLDLVRRRAMAGSR